ncbi:MAG: VOC family protein [Acidimicrobiia bacterium]|nr:VOC family protein [Acidimicrobiia bacterium]
MGQTTLPNRMHHHAHVVRDQEVTRRFYEDVLGFPLVATWCEVEDVRGKVREYCHTFYGLADGSALAFFQFADAVDYEELNSTKAGSLGHIALEVDASAQHELVRRLDAADSRYRVIDHGYCTSLYVLDPDGLTVEFTVDAPEVDEINERRRTDAHAELERWLAGDRHPNNDWRAGH